LTVKNPKLSVLGQNVSVPVLKNQRLNPFLFLILKRNGTRLHHRHQPPAERVSKAQAMAGGCITNTLEKIFFKVQKLKKPKSALQPTALFLRRGCKAVLAHDHHSERKFSEIKLSVRLSRPH